ncbi:MAG: alkaline phosphatase family protein [Kiritimatiellae bacterium]|nr:alkaline phosphatase family protein [Kiritimatiellia bacterium]
MSGSSRLAIIGFDSISLKFLETFVERGVLPTIGQLIREGCVTQTWPCFPMETGTNWACLATGASPWVTGCNMSTHLPGTPLNRRIRGFPGELCLAEQLWSAAHRAGKNSVVFDWSQSWPLRFEDGIIHIGEDGRPDNAFRALQDDMAYTTHPRKPGPHVTKIEPAPAAGWANAPAGALEFEVAIQPREASRYRQVDPLFALMLKGGAGYDRIELYASKQAVEPLQVFRLGEWTAWKVHAFTADGKPVNAGLRGKLLILSPDAKEVHLYLSEIYPQDDFVHPNSLAPELVQACGPFIIQCSRQQVVQGGASDIATYFDEQQYLGNWWRDAAGHILGTREWDLFMLKWHGPDWTNHLTMYMIDERHPMYEPDRAAEGWALWDKIMGWGDEIVARVLEAAGPDTVVALVSDHGGDTQLPGLGGGHGDPNAILARHGWLVQDKAGHVDWSRTRAFGAPHYVYLNVKGRDPDGIVEPGDEYLALREEIIEALLAATGGDGRHAYRVVLPMEDAGRLAVGGDRVGDIFLVPPKTHPLGRIDKDAFWKTHTREETGTWDWPQLNAGSHSDDSYFIISGPGVKKGVRRERPTLITSVAPTCATAAGLPVPADADGSVLWEFLDRE